MAATNKQTLTTFLEGDKSTLSPTVADRAVLTEAPAYNIDLSALEQAPVPASAHPHPSASRSAEFWSDMDVKLSDITNFIFASANYPVFIIQDDALIYINTEACKLLAIEQESTVIGRPFLELVHPDDWNLLAENVGEILTSHSCLKIRFSSASKQVIPFSIRAIYLPDIEHFSFILLGESIAPRPRLAGNSLYDDQTGLPSFFLFEDRLQMAILLERAKPTPSPVAVVGININNLPDFKRLNLDKVVIKRLADNLVFNLPKTVTVSIGLKYHFWILLNGFNGEFDVNVMLNRIKEILDAGVKDNFIRHELAYSIGVSLFPNDASSAKKLIEHTVTSVRQAQNSGGNSIVIFGEK